MSGTVKTIVPGQEYTIQSGDTLFNIATAAYGASNANAGVTAIETANPGINPNNLQVGQQIEDSCPERDGRDRRNGHACARPGVYDPVRGYAFQHRNGSLWREQCQRRRDRDRDGQSRHQPQ